jgi:BolA protein
MTAPTITDRIQTKLTAGLNPIRLEIRDDSGRHAGHGGSHPDGETHFHLTVTAAAFAGLPLVARHRLVYELLADELRERVHALALRTLAPAEDV